MNKDKELTRLIILGAGASVDVGLYPTGAQFIEIAKKIIPVCDSNDVNEWLAKEKNDQKPAYREHIAKIKNYLQNLINSSHASIDSHISYIADKDEQNFLKSLIISIILSSNSYSDLFGVPEGNLYSELSKLIFPTLSSDSKEEDKLNGIKKNLETLQIITFNYDVSLEIDLKKRVEKYFGDFDEKSQEAFKYICEKIFHVYGQVSERDKVLDPSEKYFEFLQNCKTDFEARRSEKLSAQKLAQENTFALKMTDLLNPDKKPLQGPLKLHLEIFCFLVLKNSIEISFSKKTEEDYFFDRIDVINRNNATSKIKEIPSLTFPKNLDLLYILGYGFDHDNNKILGFDNLKNYKKGCFVTNFKGNQKTERIIYDYLLSDKIKDTGYSESVYKIPLVSHLGTSESLKEDFTLLENPQSHLKITTNLTPYLAMRNNTINKTN